MATRVPSELSQWLTSVRLNEAQKANLFLSSRMSQELFGVTLKSLRVELKALLQGVFPFVHVELAEDWTAGRKGSPRDLSIAGARWSDLMICILVENPGFRDEAGLHATELEIVAALEGSWDKVVFLAHEPLFRNLEAQPDGYRDLLKRVFAFKDGKNVSAFGSRQQLFQSAVDAVAGHAASAIRRYPSRISGKSDEQAAWELKTFTERHAAIHEAFQKVGGELKDVGSVQSISMEERRREHALYRMIFRIDRRKTVALPVVVSVCPDRFSFSEAAQFVGYPFRTMTEGWKEPLGPLHITCLYRAITDGQIRKHLGNPDIRVAREHWGFFARDPERSIQGLYLTKCEDEVALRVRLQDALEWMTSNSLREVIATAESRGRILAASS